MPDSAPSESSEIVDLVRKLHAPDSLGTAPGCKSYDHDEEQGSNWPCATAALVYTLAEQNLPLWLYYEGRWLAEQAAAERAEEQQREHESRREAEFVAEAKRRGLM